MNKFYQLLDHTADLRIRVTGFDPANLFENAGMALFDLIFESKADKAENTLNLSITGADRADLLVNFLRELLYLWTGESKLVTMVAVEKISETEVKARIGISSFQPDHHEIVHEIKAVTYHQIEVVTEGTNWQATIVFDI
jgi:SHS2 domain-containing protein